MPKNVTFDHVRILFAAFLGAAIIIPGEATCLQVVQKSGTLQSVPPKSRRGTSQGVPNARLDYQPGKAPQFWSVATAETIMERYPDFRQAYWKDWTYVQGYVFHGFEMLYRSTGDKRYFNYMKRYVDSFVNEKGEFLGDKLTNLDNFMSGRSIVAMYEYTGEERYKTAADSFRRALDGYPRSDGQFWHGSKSPTMWIDGIFMGQMFLLRYGKSVGDAEYCNNEVARQITVFARHCLKGNSGLYYHAWTEQPGKVAWADSATGCSPEVWSEGLGWYALILAEAMEFLPADHPDRGQVEDIFQRLAKGLVQSQDPLTGGWYVIVDKGNKPDNWIDPSGTAMFVYALKRGVELGFLDGGEYNSPIERGYSSLFAFVTVNDRGLVDVHGGGDGITVKRDYSTYVSVPRIVNAKEAVGGLLWATALMEREALHKLRIQ